MQSRLPGRLVIASYGLTHCKNPPGPVRTIILIYGRCIIQDDSDDWRAESGRMRDVYHNAAFCIAATAAPDGNAGLFFNRDAASLMPMKIDVAWTGAEWPAPDTYRCSFAWPDAYTHIDCAPLNQRGWVAQERYLSPRILHFARKFVFWECRDTITCETHPEGLPGWIQSGNLEDDLYSLKTIVNDLDPALSMKDEIISQQEASDEIYWCWCKFLTLYTSFRLTKESDILVALRGIAQDVSEKMHDEMIAGLWRKRLLQDLCWSIRYKQSFQYRPKVWRGPSWSWVASAQPVRATRLGLSKTGESHAMSDVVDVQITTNALGDLTRAVILLRCRLVKHVSLQLRILLDEPDRGNGRERYLVFLRHHSRAGSSEVEGIAVERCDENSGDYYQRIGYFRHDEGPISFAMDLHDAQTERVIRVL
jgi:hypothetical protein